MPTGRAAATEQGLRAAQHPTGLDLLDTALRSLALNLAAAQRELPVVEAVVLHDAKVELHLAEDTAPMKPFAAAAGRKDLWVCPASSPDLADDEHLKNADAPYPALVSIGWDNTGHLVLIDLEHVGILNLTGSGDFARHVLQALAVELAITPLPSHLEVTALTHTAPGLDTAAPERVARLDDLAAATAELTSHTDDQRRALAALGADSLRAARLMDDAADAWTPHILLVESLPEDADHTAFVDALTEEPRAASAVVTASAAADLPEAAWTLDCQGPDHTIVLPGSGVPIKLQGLSDEHYADAVEILTVASSDADVPAPAWTHTDDALADEGSEAADEDGLPAEYADDEPNDTSEVEAPHASDVDAAGLATALDLTKPQPHGDTAPQSTAGPSLADILNDSGPEPMRGGAAGPTDDALPETTPCSQENGPAVHVTLPAPTAAAAPEPATASADGGPTVSLLGPISVEGAGGRIDSSRRNAAVELVAFLALNPGVDHHAIDDALWPGRPVGKELRNPVISRTRSWFGTDTDGNFYLPRVQDTGDSRYRLGPAVTNDWARFQDLARTGLTRHDEDGDLALRRALALVRGRPFTGIDPQRYAWAEPIIQEMVSAIVDVAYELAERRREAGDVSSALWAARRGLLAAEESEILHRQVFLAHHTAGDIEALRDAAAHLARINEQLLGGVDMEAETVALLRNLLPRPVTRAR
ncbi:bacterial transcriptional activator domain-containing protein [Streptomyces lunalinharesii]|uniref:Bacterial transcriptional activator domain-containing protein n=1 Tax=Streptomyces lunalinharesii TaxID=333384 RepID=A0ABN3T8K1_9ACTN